MSARQLLILLFIVILLATAAGAQTATKHLADAVVILYTQTEDGGQKMLCTATSYRKISTGYRFVSAAHCVEGDEDIEQKEQKFFITLDATGTKTFIPATLVEAGDKNVGDDFSIWEVATKENFEVIPLGDDTKLEIGEPVESIAAPLGLGKQFFRGYVSTGTIDRPKIDAGQVSWKNVFLVDIGGGPGSSGSSIVSVKQQAVVGVLVGHTGADIGKVVLPISQFKAFEAKVDAKTYKKTKREKKTFFGF